MILCVFSYETGAICESGLILLGYSYFISVLVIISLLCSKSQIFMFFFNCISCCFDFFLNCENNDI